MSWLSAGLGKISGLGKVLKKAAPFVGMIPGVGTLAAAGIGGLGGLIEGGGDSADGKGNWGGALKYGAIGGGMGALGSIGGNLLGKAIKGVGTMGLGAIGGGGGGGELPERPGSIYSALPDGMTGGIGGGPGASGGGGFDWGGLLEGVGKYAPLAMGAVGAFQNAKDATQNRQLTEEQVAQARAAIERQRMLQDRALNFQPVATPDFSSSFRTQNPFAQQAGG